MNWLIGMCVVVAIATVFPPVIRGVSQQVGGAGACRSAVGVTADPEGLCRNLPLDKLYGAFVQLVDEAKGGAS